MRKCLIKKWDSEKRGFESEFNTEGVFHQWGVSFEEYESGPGNYTIALVELPNGEIESVLPRNIKFIEGWK